MRFHTDVYRRISQAIKSIYIYIHASIRYNGIYLHLNHGGKRKL